MELASALCAYGKHRASGRLRSGIRGGAERPSVWRVIIRKEPRHETPLQHNVRAESAHKRLRLHRGRRCACERVLAEAFAAGHPQDLID